MTDNSDRQIGLPSRLGRYILLSRLTEGGMTEVYAAKLAEDVGPGRILVIKVLPRAALDDPEAESRFLEEARIVLNLTHGNITAAFEFARDDEGRPFLVMEYVPGPSLRRLCAAVEKSRERLEISDALFIIGEVCKALSYAHSFSSVKESGAGIIHRDISPDNIVISTSGQVKLTDFGIAEFMRHRAAGPIFGKPAYISPEIAAGGVPSIASDLYSTGAVLYECLTGRPPFKGANDKETLALSAFREPLQPSSMRQEIKEDLDRLVLELLDKDPEQRPKSAALVEVRIRSLLQQMVPEYTESQLSKTVGKYFQQADFSLFATKESLRAALLSAGVSLSGQETTDDLLSGSTVPLREPYAQKKESAVLNKKRFLQAALILLVVAGIAAAVALRTPTPKTDVAASSVLKTGLTDASNEPDKSVPKDRRSSDVPISDSGAFTDIAGATESATAQTRSSESSLKLDKRISPRLKLQKKERASTTTSLKNHRQGEIKGEPEWGWLNINSDPWSYVAVDGERLSGHTPYRKIKLKTGAHTLVFENPELHLKDVRKVTVIPWEETNIGVRLK